MALKQAVWMEVWLHGSHFCTIRDRRRVHKASDGTFYVIVTMTTGKRVRKTLDAAMHFRMDGPV